MRDLLFLAHRMPYPPDKGEKIRAWNMFRHLARTHRMHLGCFIDDPADWQHLPTLQAHVRRSRVFPLDPAAPKLKALLRLAPRPAAVARLFPRRRLQRWVDAKLADPAIERVFVYSSAMAHYAMHATARPPRARHRGRRFREMDRLRQPGALADARRLGARRPHAAGLRTPRRRLLRLSRCSSPSTNGSISSRSLRKRRPHRLGLERRRSRVFLPRPLLPAAVRPTGAAGGREPGVHRAAWTTGRTSMRRQWFARGAAVLRRAAARRAVLDRRRGPGPGGAATCRPARRAGDRPRARHAALYRASPMWSWRRCGSPAASRTRCWRRWPWRGRWSPRRKHLRACGATPGRDILLASGVDDTVRNIDRRAEGQHATLGTAARRRGRGGASMAGDAAPAGSPVRGRH